MGLFAWLTGKTRKVEVAEDRIWLTKKAKVAGLAREIAGALNDPNGPDATIVAAHFQDCLDDLRAAIDSAGIDDGRLLITSVEFLRGRLASGQTLDESKTIYIVVGELHPLAAHDDAVLDFARNLPCRCRLVWHVSLEDAALRIFSGQWVEGVLRRLGMKEDQAIQSRAVGRRVRSALEKVAREATGDLQANSTAEWLQRNCPQQWQRLTGCR